MKKISVIVPCYNEEECIQKFYCEFKNSISKIDKVDYELIYVNDGSKDRTLEIVKDICKKDKNTKYISFSRNFGKEAAIYAGLKKATGDYVAIMDADLQDPPSLLPTMYKIVTEEEYDCAATRRFTRKGEPPVRSFFARLFYKIMAKVSKANMVDGARDFRLMNRKMIDSILELPEYNRFSKGIFGWVGFKTKWIEYENIERVAGKTKWSFWKLFLYSLEGIEAFTTMPLVLSLIFGIILILASFILFILLVVDKLLLSVVVSKYLLLISIILFVSGLQLFCLGIVGQYFSKMYLEIKNRPVYIIGETNI